ncbi:hypothetical protein ABIA38_008881 [Embleya sp. AB8]
MSDGTYGHRRIHARLLRWDTPAGPELVRQDHARAGAWCRAGHARGADR